MKKAELPHYESGHKLSIVDELEKLTNCQVDEVELPHYEKLTN